MSHAKDRKRAQSGWIFRNGELVRAEDWYRDHPTRAMRQAQVDAAVKQELAKIATPEPIKPYFCSKCNRFHKSGAILTAHRDFATVVTV